MPANFYEFQTRWDVPAPREVLYEILRDGKDFPRWWPEVYLNAKTLEDERVALLTRGWLPYRLRWTAEVRRQVPPETIEISATGDFVGSGVWHLDAAGDVTHIRFDWQIRADKPLLRWFSPVFKPLFKWNHQWAMSTGLRRLKAEASRRLAMRQSDHQLSDFKLEEVS